MTNAELMTALTALLSSQLGTYTLPAGTTVPAIYNGEPPSDWVAAGVEVRVDPAPEYANEPLHAHTLVAHETPVRVVAHGSGSAATVVDRICQRFETSNPVFVPPSEALGILAQYTLRIRSR